MSTPKYPTAKDSYDNPEGAKNYLEFLDSEDGKLYKEILLDIFLPRLENNSNNFSNSNQRILDLACGPGWMTQEIFNKYKNVQGADGSRYFIEYASKNFSPQIKFTIADLNNALPYQNDEFDVVIISMAAHDVEDQKKTFAELRRILTTGGKLMLALPNPYYAYPVGVWKRGLLGRLLRRNPRLLVNPYNQMAKDESRDFTYNKNLESHFYKLSDQLNNLIANGFKLNYISEPEFQEDSKKYDMQYRIHRFPIITYLELTKE